jgi:hypothetical protein
MVKLLRLILVLLAAIVLVVIIADVTGRVTVYDPRLARAVVEHAQSPSQASDRELDDATSALHSRRTIQLLGLAGVLVLLCAGVALSTRAIHAQPSNHAMQRTAPRSDA